MTLLRADQPDPAPIRLAIEPYVEKYYRARQDAHGMAALPPELDLAADLMRKTGVQYWSLSCLRATRIDSAMRRPSKIPRDVAAAALLDLRRAGASSQAGKAGWNTGRRVYGTRFTSGEMLHSSDLESLTEALKLALRNNPPTKSSRTRH